MATNKARFASSNHSMMIQSTLEMCVGSARRPPPLKESKHTCRQGLGKQNNRTIIHKNTEREYYVMSLSCVH